MSTPDNGVSRSFFTQAPSATRDALLGFALSHPESIALHPEMNLVHARTQNPSRNVALVSGGGSGHEPLHASFVGVGGLDAACPGEIFTSPSNGLIYEASRTVALPGGVVHIVKNYTGDRINFSIAAERLRADGIAVGTVLVDDDLGSEHAAAGVGRRGTSATVIVEKVLGAAADSGMALDALVSIGQDIVRSSRTIAVASRAHTAPTTGSPAFDVTEGTLEYGVGIHGETAAATIAQPPLAELVDRMVGEIVAALPQDERSQHILFVNGLGGVSNLELQHILIQAQRALQEREIHVASADAGTYVSALDMRGFSITVTRAADEWLPLWLAPHQTPGLPRPELSERALAIAEIGNPASVSAGETSPAREQLRGGGSSVVLAAFDELFTNKRDALNELDQAAGDGDMGTNLFTGFSRAHAQFGVDDDASPTAAAELACIATTFLDAVGGSSGPFFGLLFQQLALAFTPDADAGDWIARGLEGGLGAIQRVGGAAPGDRTLVDALHPAVFEAEGVHRQQFDQDAVAAAIDGALATAALVARRGRASYLGERALGTPDPGSVGLAMVLTELLRLVDGAAVAPLHERIDSELLN